MEPRWNKKTLDDDGAVFLGGCGRYDLWLLRPTMLRVVWGVATSEWDTYYSETHDFYHDFYHKEPGRPQGEDFEHVKHYLRLFAPDVARELKLVED
jgi:hypothetical protein